MIHALKSLLDTGEHCHLLMLNAEYPANVSANIIEQATQMIAQLGLQNNITLNTEFLSDAKSLAYLSQADLIVFPYQATGEAASAAARYGITVQKPVATTPLSIFDDIKDVCFQLPGTDTSNIVTGLQSLISDIKNNAPEIQEKQQRQAAWYKAHTYPVIAKRLNNIVQALVLTRS